MTEYLYYLLSVIGIGYFITGSDLLESFREAVKEYNHDFRFPFNWIVDKFEGLITCIYCCSFWVALPMYYIAYSNSEIVHMIITGFSVMGLIWIIKNLGK